MLRKSRSSSEENKRIESRQKTSQQGDLGLYIQTVGKAIGGVKTGLSTHDGKGKQGAAGSECRHFARIFRGGGFVPQTSGSGDRWCNKLSLPEEKEARKGGTLTRVENTLVNDGSGRGEISSYRVRHSKRTVGEGVDRIGKRKTLLAHTRIDSEGEKYPLEVKGNGEGGHTEQQSWPAMGIVIKIKTYASWGNIESLKGGRQPPAVVGLKKTRMYRRRGDI